MKYKEGIGSKAFDIFNYLFMLLLALIWLFPLARVVALSLSEPNMIELNLVKWLPKGFNIEGYAIMIRHKLLMRSYINTVFYAVGGTFITILLTSLIAYSLSISDFIFKKFLVIYLAVTMFFSGGLIPTYLIVRNLGLINTYWAMVLPGSISAFTVVIFRTFFQSHPSSLRESAFIDGANEFVILFKIILPISKALLATFALFTIVGHWNAWFNALIYLEDSNKFNVQLILRRIVIIDYWSHGAEPEWKEATILGLVHPKNLQSAAIVLVLFPIACIFPYAQKYFMSGILIGSLKE